MPANAPPPPVTAPQDPAGASSSVPVERIHRSPNGAITDSVRLVVRDANAWAEMWARLHAGTSPSPPMPEVDFAGSLVVVAALGQRTSGGFAIAVDSATLAGDRLTVWITSTSPGATCMTTAALTAPVVAARVQARATAVEFREERRVEEC